MDYFDSVVLIVDDEKHTRDGLRMSLEDEFDIYVAADIREAAEVLKSESVDVMVTDLQLGGESGMDLIVQALKIPHPPVCILMTAFGSEEVAVEAMKRGAYDYLNKPLNIDEMELVIKRAIKSRKTEKEVHALKVQVEERFGIDNIIGKSQAMQPVFETVRQVAPTRATVLIEGESGTGKELIGKAIHNLSGRPAAKMVTVHCAALSEQLLESELFGHERGAFTGASERRIGRFEEADGGTLFLDEIGEIDGNTQVKLLRAIGERTIERLGSNKPIKVDVRVIAATNRNLLEMVNEGTFRDDLYFRLNVVSITMPPLRERKEDIVLMVDAFLKEFCRENSKPVMELTRDAQQRLLEYDFPGNVRELRTAIEHGVVMCNNTRIGLRHLPPFLREQSDLHTTLLLPGGSPSEPKDEAQKRGEDFSDLNLAKMEQRYIRTALSRTGGNRTEAAKLLGISRRTMQRKIKEMEESEQLETVS